MEQQQQSSYANGTMEPRVRHYPLNREAVPERSAHSLLRVGTEGPLEQFNHRRRRMSLSYEGVSLCTSSIRVCLVQDQRNVLSGLWPEAITTHHELRHTPREYIRFCTCSTFNVENTKCSCTRSVVCVYVYTYGWSIDLPISAKLTEIIKRCIYLALVFRQAALYASMPVYFHPLCFEHDVNKPNERTSRITTRRLRKLSVNFYKPSIFIYLFFVPFFQLN